MTCENELMRKINEDDAIQNKTGDWSRTVQQKRG